MRNLDIPDKNQLFGDFLTSIEDEWMEKDVVNSYVRECGGRRIQVRSATANGGLV